LEDIDQAVKNQIAKFEAKYRGWIFAACSWLVAQCVAILKGFIQLDSSSDLCDIVGSSLCGESLWA